MRLRFLCLLCAVACGVSLARAQDGVLLLSDGSPAFVEQLGPNGADPCGPDAVSTFGCEEVGGNFIYPSLNGTGDYLMSSCCAGAAGPEESIGAFAPNDFEIRHTRRGSVAAYIFDQTANGGANTIVRVRFEVWDIGPTPPGTENDPSDDVRMIPVLYADTGGTCEFNIGEAFVEADGTLYPATDRIYAYYPVAGLTYDDWEEYAKSFLETRPEICADFAPSATEAQALFDDYGDLGRGRPLQRVVFLDASFTGDEDAVLGRSIQRFYTVDPGVSTEGPPGAPDAYRLMEAYPNPFRVRTTVPFEVETTGAARLVAYDLLGRAVAVLFDGVATAGRHEATFEAAHLAPGLYVVVLEAEGAARSHGKVLLVR